MKSREKKGPGRPAGSAEFDGKLVHIRLSDEMMASLEEIRTETSNPPSMSWVIREALRLYIEGKRGK
jgi:predicted DNA-binding protein